MNPLRRTVDCVVRLDNLDYGEPSLHNPSDCWGSRGVQHPLGEGRGQYPARGVAAPQNRRFCGVYSTGAIPETTMKNVEVYERDSLRGALPLFFVYFPLPYQREGVTLL